MGESKSSSETYSIIFSATSEIVPSTYFISTSYFLSDLSRIIWHFLFVPTTNFPASSKFPTVADNPIFVSGYFEFNSNLSMLKDSWEPLSLASNSCTSSIITHSKSDNAFSILICVNKITRVSGVVIRMSGGSSLIFLLSFWEVSPCLISIDSSLLCAYFVILRNTSRFNARKGVM